MDTLIELLEQYGLSLVFFNVLLEQLGAPLPAYPSLVITGALSERGDYSPALLLATAVVAALRTAPGTWPANATAAPCWPRCAASRCRRIPASTRPNRCTCGWGRPRC